MPGATVIAAEASGLPAALMILAVLGVLIAAGIAIGGKRARALRLAGLCALLFVVGLVIADIDDDGETTPQSLTPRITSSQDTDLQTFLLTMSDVRSVPSFGGARTRALEDINLFENPDPRGPCGTPVEDLPTDGAAGRAFERDGLSVFQFVMEGRRATDFLDSHLDDIHDPCGPYDSTTNTGATQHVEGIDVQRLDSGRGYYMTALARSDEGRAAFSVVAVGVEDRVSILFGIGLERVPEPELRTLADLLRDRLS